MDIVEIICKKRDKYELSSDEIKYFLHEYCNDKIEDYQISALLMAIYLNGMSKNEIYFMTNEMVNSGVKVNLNEIEGIKVDKHSTGGVGDKTTLILGPIVAACGVPFAKMSGRALGYTGGTIDKLESISGFKTSLTIEEYIDNIKKIGISIIGQSENIALADKKLYSLRDVTGTVNSKELIASSIMSKKIATGADKLVLDVKFGVGSIIGNLTEAREIAKLMVEIGNLSGVETISIISSMESPLGNSIGNSLEVIEAIEFLKGNSSQDLEEVVYSLSTHMLYLAKKGNMQKCLEMSKSVIKSGKALKKFCEFIEMQGGNGKIVDDYSLLKSSKYSEFVIVNNEGYISKIDARKLGFLNIKLGGGRLSKNEKVSHSSGIVLLKKVGDYVKKGDKILKLFSDKKDLKNEIENFDYSTYEITKEKIELSKKIIEIIK